MCKLKDELIKLEPDSNDVFKRNNLDRYKNRPHSGIFNAKHVDFDQANFVPTILKFILITQRLAASNIRLSIRE